MPLIPSTLLGKIASLGHITSGLGMIANSMTGDGKPTGGGLIERFARMIPGVLSGDDERAFETLLQQIEKLDCEGGELQGKEPRKTITDFSHWHFKQNCAGEMIVSWWYGNEFRKFVSHLDDGDDKEVGINFLKWMVKVIHSKPVRVIDGKPNREEGFAELVRQLAHVPHVPEGAAAYIARAQVLSNQGFKASVQGYRDAKASLIHHRRAIERKVEENKAKPKSFLDRFIK